MPLAGPASRRCLKKSPDCNWDGDEQRCITHQWICGICKWSNMNGDACQQCLDIKIVRSWYPVTTDVLLFAHFIFRTIPWGLILKSKRRRRRHTIFGWERARLWSKLELWECARTFYTSILWPWPQIDFRYHWRKAIMFCAHILPVVTLSRRRFI